MPPFSARLPAAAGFEFDDLFAVDHVSNLDRPAADFAVFDIRLASHRSIEDHRDVFTAIRTSEIVFHNFHLSIDISATVVINSPVSRRI
jgi:hypothetical protein